MKKNTKNKIKEFFVGSFVNVQIRIPFWLLVLIILIPFAAYFDYVLIGKTTFVSYLYICTIEVFFMWVGYLFAINEIKFRNIHNIK